MRVHDQRLILSASDLAQHLGCRHRTLLELAAARKELEPPRWNDPALEALQELGFIHERAYVESLRDQGLSIVAIKDQEDGAVRATEAALREGVDVIVQGTLAYEGWFGRPDILMKVPGESRLGPFRYEVYDTKLARDTRAGTILQLCLYSDLLGVIQGALPESFWVVSPGSPFDEWRYRVLDYLAYYRLVCASLLGYRDRDSRLDDLLTGVPEPTPHCDLCRWWPRCERQWRSVDHLSLVANITRLQRRELLSAGITTLESLATMPLPPTWKPRRGTVGGLVRSALQARIQLEGRRLGVPVHELLLPLEEGRGLLRLPAPSAGDLFLDIEGDPFAGPNGREYLFGAARIDADGDRRYESAWAIDEAEERKAFEHLVDEFMAAWDRDPGMHVYHYAPYEPATLKRLMGRYATRENEIDRLLRAERFVDLYAVVRHALRASVEKYSIKDLEPFYGHERDMPLRDVAWHKRSLERALELGRPDSIAPESRQAVERYNRDDCISALALRDWLESLRAELEAEGTPLSRPAPKEGEPADRLTERLERARALAAELVQELPEAQTEWSRAQRARWLLAQLLEFHRREDKGSWWEFYRLCELSDEEFLDEREAITGLVIEERLGGTDKHPIFRYSFPPQETDLRRGDSLRAPPQGIVVGEIIDIDPQACRVDIKHSRAMAELYPVSVFRHEHVNKKAQEGSLDRLAAWVTSHDIDGPGAYRAARDLLLGNPPRLEAGSSLRQSAEETDLERACRLALELDHGVLAIQGPPGSGKTFTGARMIAALVQAGKKVGVTAIGHHAIRNMLDEVVRAASKSAAPVRCLKKCTEPESSDLYAITNDNAVPLAALASGEANVVGGTAWLWAREEYAQAVDVLFVDEAGQMSLAEVLAVTQAADSLVLLGDPRQLEQPIQGSHPPGVAQSALDHLLDGHLTIPEDRGLFLHETWRLAPPICSFTSEAFYEGRLLARPFLERQRIDGDTPFAGAGLWWVPVVHDGNQNSSPEEVDRVEQLVNGLLESGAAWIDGEGVRRPLRPQDILIVAPYNAHVARITERLGHRGTSVGTVDRFQGRQAPIVIYSLATSTPEDAPRGMEFLYSSNRLNVATSRAQCAVVMVANPRLFEPDCRSPRQMQLANAFCRYLDLARIVGVPASTLDA